MRYGLIAIDVDGTLLGPDHRLRPGVGQAIRRARDEALRVVLATGRSYAETIGLWRQLDLSGPFEPLVLVGGALVSEPDTGRTLWQKPLPVELACELAGAFGQAGYAAMALVDAWRHGWDYVLCETGNARAARRDWLDKTGAKVRPARALADVTDMPDPLRISVVVNPQDAEALAEEMRRRFGGRASFHAVRAPNYGVTTLQAFAPGAGKGSALRYVAQGYGLALKRTVAVGDDVNDLDMIRGAGLGVAMPDAAPELAAAADVVAAGGLADFIASLLDGELEQGAEQ